MILFGIITCVQVSMGRGSQQICFSEQERVRVIPGTDGLPCLLDLPVVEMSLIIARVAGREAAFEKAFSGRGLAGLARIC
jgi:hypothetical protein